VVIFYLVQFDLRVKLSFFQIPIASPNEASELAVQYYKEGFGTLKLKVGKDLNSDIEVVIMRCS
jgi:L-alanine-DL-glutamate epimerase-like enolase superfamily enzyme